MTRYALKFVLQIVAALMLSIACGPVATQAVSPAATRLPAPGQQILARVIDSYTAGSFEQVIVLSDSLLNAIPATQSQLGYLGAYYGIKARLELGQAPESVAEFLIRAQPLIPEKQFGELELIADVRAETAMGGRQGGPEVAYKLGVILPLSGQHFEFGEAVLEGVKLAVEEFNANTGGRKVELDVRDDAGEPVRAGALGRALAEDSTVMALIGSHGNEPTLSLALISAAQGIPLVCPTADAPGLDAIGNTIHVLNRTDRKLSATVADAAVGMLGLHTFAVLAEQDERGNLLAGGFIQQVRASGGTIVADLRYSADASNFENQMSFIQRYLPDAIYLTAKSDMITQLASQVHYYGMGRVQLIGGEYWDSERVIRMGGDYVNGGLFSSPFYEESDRLRWRQFKDSYERSHRKPVNRFSAYGYDAAGIILASLEKVPASRGELALRMRSGREYDGATGIYTIGTDGRVERNYFILRLANGHIVPAEKKPLPESSGEIPSDSTSEETLPADAPN